MNIMKRSVYLFLIISMLSLLFGCGDESIISLDEIPEYSGKPYVVINGGEPFFEEDEITAVAYEDYSPLDALGRCGAATACLGKEIMPTEERGDISSVKPTGWEYNDTSNNREYDFGYIYNRCHLIGFQLAGEDANEKNLITGTAYMNVEGMLPFEDMVAEYIEDTENHVMYRVTPMFDSYNYVASGVLMEAYSVEDEGDGIKFCVYAYNVQPGIEIDYYTGKNRAVGEGSFDDGEVDNGNDTAGDVTYIINKSSGKFHLPEKSCADSIKEENRLEYSGGREELIEDGYSPCGVCNP